MQYLTDNRNLGIRGLLPYRSSFNARARGDTRDALSSQRVYRLKSAGESTATWRTLILAAKDDLQCGVVWVVPSHLPGTINALQSIFGATICRVKETVPRKYDHAAPVDLSSMAFPPAEPGIRALLVDDVATTGATLVSIREHLAVLGVEAVPLACGIAAKLLPKNFDAEPYLRQWEAAAKVPASDPAGDGGEGLSEHAEAALQWILGFTDGSLEAQALEPDPWQNWKQVEAGFLETRMLKMPNPGVDAATRKRHDRALMELEKKRLIVKDDKFIGLTPDGDRTGRELAGLPTVYDAANLLAALLTAPKAVRWSNGAVSESSLVGLPPYPRVKEGEPRTPIELSSFLQYHVAPLAVAGLVCWLHVPEADGVYLYAMTEAGIAWADAHPGTLAAWIEMLRDRREITPPQEYADGWLRAFNGRATAEPEEPNRVYHQDICDAPQGRAYLHPSLRPSRASATVAP